MANTKAKDKRLNPEAYVATRDGRVLRVLCELEDGNYACENIAAPEAASLHLTAKELKQCLFIKS